MRYFIVVFVLGLSSCSMVGGNDYSAANELQLKYYFEKARDEPCGYCSTLILRAAYKGHEFSRYVYDNYLFSDVMEQLDFEFVKEEFQRSHQHSIQSESYYPENAITTLFEVAKDRCVYLVANVWDVSPVVVVNGVFTESLVKSQNACVEMNTIDFYSVINKQ
jgi:hypothetical protein